MKSRLLGAQTESDRFDRVGRHGQTGLAKAVCYDDDVIDFFKVGILWVTPIPAAVSDKFLAPRVTSR